MAGKKIIQIVGFQNSGKTTLIERLITACKEMKLAVGTIKHHGHGNAPDRVFLNKDSEKHQQAGAIVSTVEGAGSLHLEAKKEKWELQEIVQMYEQLPIDIILVEGYKRMNYPKVVLVRNPQDEFLLEELTNIMAIISNEPLSSTSSSIIFRQEEMDRFISWFMKQINAAED
ncbi:molybdopterin-guanine dinucleotide biosynthesis protein B [Bacillus norwichensis]|uniref:Molybdopterin-guanine dinucleotide biosynthesis protein B n=1 Tax=Bacillus norwichensis TaxID=2762217 RepID=A0ABR8VJQ1_9BACI|nr:molybdopterin-guanine dinucleotide biosynthesis protein B [Bacillus norwichensis]MBD8004994.1 molybdopterin-guanine dinucleotide biosynthesis protein B [Bacillus norwichensis]